MHPTGLTRIAALLVALALIDCAQNPVTGNPNLVLMTESQEIAIGRREDTNVRRQYDVYDDPQLQQYVSEIGERLAKASHRPELQYRFLVVDSPEVNAFALPGGYIYITRGILAYFNSEAELAGVLGHELGHVTARHSVQQISAATAANVGGNSDIALTIEPPLLRAYSNATAVTWDKASTYFKAAGNGVAEWSYHTRGIQQGFAIDLLERWT